MLTKLTSLVHAPNELTFSSIYYDDSNVSLRCSSQHVPNKVSVTRCIDKRECSRLREELRVPKFDSDTSLALCLHFIEDHCEFIRGSMSLFSAFFEFQNLAIIDP